MKKYFIIAICLSLIALNFPVWAEEQLMTKLYFDNWLRNATSPLEQQINALKNTFSQLENDIRKLRSQLTTTIKVTIGQKSAVIDDKTTQLDVAPINQNGRTMVPVRFIGEAFGANFAWDEKARKVTYTLDNLKIELYIGKTKAYVNGKSVILDTSPIISEGRTMVPLRFVGESLGAKLEWDNDTQTATILR